MKRPNGTGTVVKLSGTRRRPYAVRVPARDERGRVVQKTLSYHAKAQEAHAALDEYNRLRAAGRAPEANKLDMTVKQIFEAWNSREYKKLGSASIISHNAAWNKWVSRYADRKFRNISLDEWQAILDDAEDQGRSQSTVNNIALLIKALFRYSMERDIIGKDYSAYLDIPSIDPIVAKGTLDDLQLAKLDAMAKSGVPYADTVLILCYTGFRISEFISLTRFSYHSEQGGYLQGGIKTAAGKNRIIPIHPKIRGYVDTWLENGTDVIFTDPSGGAFTPKRYREIFSGIMEQIGAPDATPHWCRHTFATRLHAAHADPLSVKWLLGHSTKGDVTARYTHDSLPVLVDAIGLLA